MSTTNPHAVLVFTESRVHSFGSKLLSSPTEVSHQKISHQQIYLHTSVLPPMLFEQMLLLLDDVRPEDFSTFRDLTIANLE